MKNWKASVTKKQNKNSRILWQSNRRQLLFVDRRAQPRSPNRPSSSLPLLLLSRLCNSDLSSLSFILLSYHHLRRFVFFKIPFSLSILDFLAIFCSSGFFLALFLAFFLHSILCFLLGLWNLGGRLLFCDYKRNSILITRRIAL